jgi:8-oxo-dGTP diphosphatase
MAKHIELIARGVCVRDGRVLLCHGKGHWNTYLPGGHIEFGEPAAESLRREIEEEIGVAATVGRFLGGIEHAYERDGKPICEINLVFEMVFPDADDRRSTEAQEDDLEFYWAAFEALAEAHLEPAPLQRLIPQWLQPNAALPGWASTMG